MDVGQVTAPAGHGLNVTILARECDRAIDELSDPAEPREVAADQTASSFRTTETLARANNVLT